MAHTNSTTNYNLPQFLPTDKPAWLVDVNPAYASIDTAIKNASDAAGNAQEDATQALSDAAGAQAIATQANSKADGAIASISEQFLDTETYQTGEYVVFNNILYVCTEPVTTPGPWTGSVNWSRASVDSIAASLNASISTINASISTINEALRFSSQTVSIPTYGGTLFCRKFGRVVSLTLDGLGTTAAYPSDNTLNLSGIIPQAYRPSVDERVCGPLTGNLTGSALSIYNIKSDGTISVYSYTEISRGKFSISYIV